MQIDEAYNKLIHSQENQTHEKLTEMYWKSKEEDIGLDYLAFHDLLKELCSELNEKEISLLFDKFDENQDKRISYE